MADRDMNEQIYGGFSQVYDLFMDNVPYAQWCRWIRRKLERYGIKDGLVLDLGCGTGGITIPLAEAGYDMIGVDSAAEMLQLAREKCPEKLASRILFLNQDMSSFELYGTVRAAVSICDSLNYLLEEEQLLETFRLVNNYLDPGGIFLFDMNTPYKYEHILGENIFAENRDEGSFIWENSYDSAAGLNEYALTLYHAAEGGLYRRYEETHWQRSYSLDQIRTLIEKAGMIWEGVWDGYTDSPPHAESERLVMAVRECGK